MKLRNKELHRKWHRKEKVIKAAIKLSKTGLKSDISKEVKPKVEKLDKVEKPKKTTKTATASVEKTSTTTKKEPAAKKTTQKKESKIDVISNEPNNSETILENPSEEANLSS